MMIPKLMMLPLAGRNWGGIPTGITQNVFQSTLLAQRGTEQEDTYTGAIRFQSTLPAWGGTLPAGTYPFTVTFQSTLPAWEGTRSASSC